MKDYLCHTDTILLKTSKAERLQKAKAAIDALEAFL